MLSNFILIVNLFGFAFLRGEEHKAKNISLEEAIASAIENSIQLAKTKLGDDLTGLQLTLAYAELLPSVSASASGALSSSNLLAQFNTNSQLVFAPVSSDAQSLNASLTASLNIFDGLANVAKIGEAVKEKESSAYNLERAKEDIAFDIIQKFFQVIMDREILELSQRNYKIISQTVKNTEKQFKSGTKRKSEVLQQKAEQLRTELQLVKSKNQYENSVLVLLQAARLQTDGVYKIKAPTLDSLPLSSISENVSYLVDLAERSRKDLEANKRLLEKFQWKEVGARSLFFPKFSINGSINTNGNYTTRALVFGQLQPSVEQQPLLNEQLASQWSFSLGATLSWNISSVFVAPFQLQAALIQTQQAEQDVDKLKQDIRSQVLRALNDYQSAQKELETARKVFEAEELSFKSVSEGYKLGTSNWLELQNTQRNIFKAEADLIRALMNFDLKKKQIFYAVGGLDKKIKINY